MKKLMYLVCFVLVLGPVLMDSCAEASLIDGLVAYWPFDDNAEDSVGGNHGTLVGNASYVDGKLGKAVATSSDGTSDYVAFDTTSDGLTEAWTVAAWMYVHNQHVGGFIDGYFGDPADDDCYGLRLPGAFNAVPHPGMVDYPGNINASWDGDDSDTLAYETLFNTWTLLVFVGSDTQCELFADGVSQGTIIFAETRGTQGDSTNEEDPPMQFKLTWDRLGNMVKYSSFGDAVADYDELAIWDRSLTYEEIQDLWNSGQGTQLLLPSVLSPGDGDTVLINENLELSWENISNDSNSVYVEVWWGTEPNELHPAYDMASLDLDPDSGQDVDSVTVDSSAVDTYYWRVNSYLNGADHINEPNMVEGALWSYTTVADFAPAVEIVTPAQMAGSGVGVPLDATVTDDAVSAVTVEWTADDDSVADPNLTINIAPDNEDATVTITKTFPTDDVVTVTMTVTVGDEGNPAADSASVEIDVYDDACHLARVGQGKSAVTDFNGDCITALEDLAVAAAAWLDDYSPTGPLDRP